MIFFCEPESGGFDDFCDDRFFDFLLMSFQAVLCGEELFLRVNEDGGSVL